LKSKGDKEAGGRRREIEKGRGKEKKKEERKKE